MAGEVRIVASRAELAAHLAVRKQVFVDEQRLFAGSDRDPWDHSALHAVAVRERRVVGAVRLYALDEAGLWKGDRLAVVPGARRGSTARDLVRFAVGTAGALGGSLMLAQVQVPNVRFFLRLGWEPVGEPFGYRGVPHQRMSIGLSGYEPADGGQWALGTAVSGG